jgi:glycosyltransferase involved in cell wall biosynthesis
VIQAGAGLAVPYSDVRGLEEAVRRLVSNPDLRRELGSAGRRAAEKLYSRKEIAKKLDQLLLSVTSAAQLAWRGRASIPGL